MTARRQLAGLRAIVTGASSGVGRAVASELLARGGYHEIEPAEPLDGDPHQVFSETGVGDVAGYGGVS